MSAETTGDAVVAAVVSPEVARALAALLAIDSETAARIRERTPPRRRPTPQYGPQLDIGD